MRKERRGHTIDDGPLARASEAPRFGYDLSTCRLAKRRAIWPVAHPPRTPALTLSAFFEATTTPRLTGALEMLSGSDARGAFSEERVRQAAGANRISVSVRDFF